MNCPCKGCTDRTITCHAVCPRYGAWKENHDAANQWLRDQLPVISDDAKKRQRKLIRSTARGWKGSKHRNGRDE